jgi:hypothetical protein
VKITLPEEVEATSPAAKILAAMNMEAKVLKATNMEAKILAAMNMEAKNPDATKINRENQVNLVNQGNQDNLVNPGSQVILLNPVNQVNQVNPVSQVILLNPGNLNPVNLVNLNPVNLVNPASQIKDLAVNHQKVTKITTKNQINQVIQTRDPVAKNPVERDRRRIRNLVVSQCGPDVPFHLDQ